MKYYGQPLPQAVRPASEPLSWQPESCRFGLHFCSWEIPSLALPVPKGSGTVEASGLAMSREGLLDLLTLGIISMRGCLNFVEAH